MTDFFPASRDEILNWDGEDAEFLFKLNSHGIFPAPLENAEDFRQRLLKEYAYVQKISDEAVQKNSKIILWQTPDGSDKIEVRSDAVIERELFEPAFEITRNLYDFAIDYVPGFYLFEKVGLLWGGCSIYDDETEMKVFLLRPAFRNKKRFLIYDRTELIAHELCHCARQVIHDHDIEEYFAYQTSRSLLRKYIGNCFTKEFDALLFLLPALLLPIAQTVKSFVWTPLPLLPFWGFLGGVLGFFLFRNQKCRNTINKARKNLQKISGNPEAVLFRSTLGELKKLNVSFDEYFNSLSPMRKKIIGKYLK